MKTVKFIKDFATKKKGEEVSVDSMLANRLVTDKVAKYIKEKEKE